MKKLVSILLALVFCVSLCTVTTVAFAADKHDKDAAKRDLVGAWAGENNSRLQVKEKEFSGTLHYKTTNDDGSESTQNVSVSGKYTYTSQGVFTKTEEEGKEVDWNVSYESGTFTFWQMKKPDEGKGEEGGEGDEQEPAEPQEPEELFRIELTRRTISFDQDTFDSLPALTEVDMVQSASEKFQFDYEWLQDESRVEAMFPNISYTLIFGDWTAKTVADNPNAIDVTWKLNPTRSYTTQLTKVTGADSDSSDDDSNPYVGKWTGKIEGKDLEIVFDANLKVEIQRNGLSLKTNNNTISYKIDDDGVATFTTGDSAKPYAVANNSDKIYVQYATPTVDYKDFSSWNTVEIGTDINVIGTTSSTSRLGWWVFRFVVRDSAGTVLTDGEGNEIRSDRIDIWFYDGTEPAYRDNKGLTSDMISVRDNGLTVAETYTIKTNLRYIDNGTVTVKYYVEKYDSKSKKWTTILVKGESVTEGYEDCISASGVITPLESDVLTDKEGNPIPVYRIVYQLVDDQLYESEETVLELFVKEPEAGIPTKASDVWKIILYVIAGLSAVGIVVVLFIKPKQPQAEDTRISRSSTSLDTAEPTAMEDAESGPDGADE